MLRKRFITTWILVFGLFAIFPEMAKAETSEEAPLQMEELTIQILPEYSYHPEDNEQNHPPLLVGYHGALKNNTDVSQKGRIELPLPSKEENFKIGFVGDYSNDLREIYEIEYEFDKDTGIISWETSEEIEPQGIYKFVIEFYTNSIEKSEEKKMLEYHFKSFTDIGLVHFIFVEPLKTDSFKLEPAPESHQTNSFNMNMFSYMAQGMKIGDEKAIQLEYERTDNTTTKEILTAMAASDFHQGAAVKNEEKIPGWKIALVVGAVTVVAAAVLIIILRRHSKNLKTTVENSSKNDSKEDAKKAKLRSMLLDGSITQEEYNELLKK